MQQYVAELAQRQAQILYQDVAVFLLTVTTCNGQNFKEK
jgi:hypothetical protein